MKVECERKGRGLLSTVPCCVEGKLGKAPCPVGLWNLRNVTGGPCMLSDTINIWGGSVKTESLYIALAVLELSV